MKKGAQRAMHCPCGRDEILALGLCSTCYSLKRQDEEHFGGHREHVLARDGYRCRIPGCHRAWSGKRVLAVHHRQPGNNDEKLMITLCLAHHAMVTRTQLLCKEWPELLRTLWREQHPDAHEQTTLDFSVKKIPAKLIPLFPEIKPRDSKITGALE